MSDDVPQHLHTGLTRVRHERVLQRLQGDQLEVQRRVGDHYGLGKAQLRAQVFQGAGDRGCLQTAERDNLTTGEVRSTDDDSGAAGHTGSLWDCGLDRATRVDVE